MEMGKEIRRLRNNRGITQEALAAALNVTAQTVSKWECGNSIPDVQLLPEIAVYFGITIDQLFAMTPDQQLERMENHIYASGMLSEAEQRQMEQQLQMIAEKPEYEGKAQLMLTKLTRPELRGTYFGWSGSLNKAGGIVCSLLGGSLFLFTDVRGVYMAAALVKIMMIPMMIPLMIAIKKEFFAKPENKGKKLEI
jgi:transcriptional regulator with XRE-family HTH domain